MKKGHEIPDVHALDLLPTILAYLYLPVADDLSGQVRTDIFINPPRQIKRIPTYETMPYEPILKHDSLQSSQFDKEQQEELKMLGYIS